MVKTRKIMMTKSQLAQSFGISLHTTADRIKEIEEEVRRGRYGRHSVVRDVGFVACNPLVFADYMVYRQKLRNEITRKYVPEYDAAEVVRELELELQLEEA